MSDQRETGPAEEPAGISDPRPEAEAEPEAAGLVAFAGDPRLTERAYTPEEVGGAVDAGRLEEAQTAEAHESFQPRNAVLETGPDRLDGPQLVRARDDDPDPLADPDSTVSLGPDAEPGGAQERNDPPAVAAQPGELGDLGPDDDGT